jgi:hypothetical protein
MTLRVLCSACQFGRHAEHQRVVQAVPEGMMGGAMCPCTGDCAGNEPAYMKKIHAAFRHASRANGRSN